MNKPVRKKPLRSPVKASPATGAPKRTGPYNPAMAKARALPSHVEHLVRLLPALNITQEQADQLIARLVKMIKAFLA